MGPCMCGDTHCWSCGPAQGNFRCYVCGAWDDCGGCSDPEECAKKLKEIDDAENRIHEAFGQLEQDYNISMDKRDSKEQQ